MSKCYFQFENREDGLYFNLYKGTDDIVLDELLTNILKYIDKAKITSCDLIAIKTAIVSGQNTSVRVGQCCLPCNEWGEYIVSEDRLSLYACFYPGFVNSAKLSPSEIARDIMALGVKHGIDSSVINRCVQYSLYFENICLVKGTPAIEAKDAQIVYDFDIDKKSQPKIKEDGTVDYHDLDNLNHVKAGDMVAHIIPEVEGIDGLDIYGKIIIPKRPKKAVFKKGKNLIVSEDGLQLISEVNGHVTLEGDTIFVSNVLELNNIDASTGDIDYDGDVRVNGNIVSGYSLKASGDVEVRGIVEGASLVVDGNLTLIKGIQGMNKAFIKCKKNMTTKFIESADMVIVGGDLITDSILHSKVEVAGYLEARGRNGLIIGGDVRASKMITAKTIGNLMETSTIVGVGVDPSNRKLLDVLSKEVIELENQKFKLNQLLTALRKKQEIEGTLDAEKMELLQKTMRNTILADQNINSKKKKIEKLRVLLNEDSNARIKVEKNLYSGVKIVFGDISMFIKNTYDHCQFVKLGADIKSLPL